MRHNFLKSVITFLAAADLPGVAHGGQDIPRGSGFQYDYCSMGLQVEVYNDAQDYVIDIFNGYKIPMDPYTCPFHPQNLEYIREAKNLSLWKRAKKIGSRDKAECPICRKTFKTGEYYEFHVKTAHPFSIAANNFEYKLGSQFYNEPIVAGGNQKQQISAQSSQVCLADYCDIFPCKETSVKNVSGGNTRRRPNDRSEPEVNVLKTNAFKYRSNYGKRVDRKSQKGVWRGLDGVMDRSSMELLE